MKPATRGMVLGKFLPPHQGHVYLVSFAQAYVDELAVVVGSLKREPIPGTLRHQWMNQLFPQAQILHLTDENPQYPEEDPHFWEIWEASLKRILPWSPDYIFASEPYGFKLAEVLNAQFIPVDPQRHAQPISGTQIRNQPWKYWDYIPPCVRSYFLKRICIFGPESTGKTTLTQQLANHYQTVWVPEYARTLIEMQNGRIEADDMQQVVRGQQASALALAPMARRYLFQDTDALATVIWQKILFKQTEPWILEQALKHQSDLYLLCQPDVPWVADQARYLPDQGWAFFEQCQTLLDAHQCNYTVISGDWDSRYQAAIQAINKLGKPLENTCSDSNFNSGYNGEDNHDPKN